METINLPSLYIPSLLMSTEESHIRKIFSEYFQSDNIKHIDIVERINKYSNNPYKIAFIHFLDDASISSTHEFSKKIELLEEGGDVKLMINSKNYWILRKNIGKKREEDENPFDPTSPISDEINDIPKLVVYTPKKYKSHPYNNHVPMIYPLPKLQNIENCYFNFNKKITSLSCEKISKVLQHIWGVTYIIHDSVCMWECKYLGFKFVLDLWYKTPDEYLFLEMRNIECDDKTFITLRKYIFNSLSLS